MNVRERIRIIIRPIYRKVCQAFPNTTMFDKAQVREDELLHVTPDVREQLSDDDADMKLINNIDLVIPYLKNTRHLGRPSQEVSKSPKTGQQYSSNQK